MSQYVELDDIQLLAPNLGLSLSVSSHLFVSNNADLELDCQRLYDSVRAKQLWFLPPSVFYLQLKMRVGDREMHTVLPESNFLEYCANTICLSTVGYSHCFFDCEHTFRSSSYGTSLACLSIAQQYTTRPNMRMTQICSLKLSNRISPLLYYHHLLFRQAQYMALLVPWTMTGSLYQFRIREQSTAAWI